MKPVGKILAELKRICAEATVRAGEHAPRRRPSPPRLLQRAHHRACCLCFACWHQVRQVIEQIKTRPASLDAKVGSSEDGAKSVLDLVVDDTTRIESDVVQNMLRTDLGRLMAKHLRPQEVDVLTLRFGLGDGHARTVRQTADELGMPYATVKHMLFQAMNKMRKPHVAIALKDYLADAIEVDD